MGLPVNFDKDGFTGHIKDSATGLNYMQARYYDPLIGRFLSIDPQGFKTSAPGSFNRYAYTYNDPVNMFDPNGESGLPAWFNFGSKDAISNANQSMVASGSSRGFDSVSMSPDSLANNVGAVVATAGAEMLMNGAANTPLVAAMVASPVDEAAAAGASVAKLTTRAKEIHSVLDPIAHKLRTTAIVATKEGGRFVASNQKHLSPAQRAVLKPGETAVSGSGHAEMTAQAGAEAAGQTPLAVGASRGVCPDCAGSLGASRIRYKSE